MFLTDRVMEMIRSSREKKSLEKQRQKEKAQRKEQARKDFYRRKVLAQSEQIYNAAELDKSYLDGISKASDEAVQVSKTGLIRLKTTKKRDKGVRAERLHKVIARTGMCSNRKAEQLIREGRVSVNGERAILGQQIDLNDASLKVRVDGEIIKHRASLKQSCQVLIYHKAEGEISSRKDPEGRKTVFDRLPRLAVGRWVQVGRLDANTSGLLLFTNDGELAHRLMHPSYHIERKYLCRVYGEVTPEILEKITRGVELEDGIAKFDEIRPIDSPDFEANNQGRKKANAWFEVTLREGRKHEVRRIWESQDVIVSRLIRIEYAGIKLSRQYSIPQSGYLEADLNEINLLRGLVGLAPETEGFKPEDYGYSKSEAKRLKSQHLRTIRRAISKDKLHRAKNEKVYDEKNKEQHEKRKQLAERISQSNKRKFNREKDKKKGTNKAVAFIEKFYK
ncbi:23S rRNA pseudouridine(2605) synthase RluB [Psittacicella hinzii]|uniref:Pseudouridine synthase n=1 Tax=Psittacicella hinzii TaxID=2028575 RepID=A0A3A1YNU3_9GAMM|nr:pseudouridine synthase [Psittacicella hinzii]RIY37954.1 hypothetical protein CKF58_04405 [Psittacicella hinzii]